MKAVESLGCFVMASHVLLTCFLVNDLARRFYMKTLGYSVDAISPGNWGRVTDYEILSKPIGSSSTCTVLSSR